MTAATVGIGTIKPSLEAHIYSNTNGSDGFKVENNNTGSSAQAYFLITQNGNTDHYIFCRSLNHFRSGPSLGPMQPIFLPTTMLSTWATYNAAPLNFWTNNAQRMTILSDGNVGIGTAVPGSYKLNINGSLIATNITAVTALRAQRPLPAD